MIRGFVDEGRVNVGAYVEPSLKRQLVELAYLNSQSVSEVVRTALREHVKTAQEPIQA